MYIDEASAQILKQPWFLGSHSDVAHDDETGCINDIVLAWSIANLEHYAGIVFDEAKLAIRFPRMGADLPISNHTSSHPVWVDPIRDPVKGLWRLMGRSTRIPNSSPTQGKRTNETVHVTARLRGYGSSHGQEVVPGHGLERQSDNFVWKRNQSQPLTTPSDSGVLREEVLTPREAHLLGISVAQPGHE